jgi:hypothetical protein
VFLWFMCFSALLFHTYQTIETLDLTYDIHRNQTLERDCMTKCLTSMEGKYCELHFEWSWGESRTFNSTDQRLQLGCRIIRTKVCDSTNGSSTNPGFHVHRTSAISAGTYGGPVSDEPRCFYTEDYYRLPFPRNETSDETFSCDGDRSTTIYP